MAGRLTALRPGGQSALYVTDLDAVDGTPVYDLGPYFQEMGPRGDVHEPEWPGDMLKDYWTESQNTMRAVPRSPRHRPGGLSSGVLRGLLGAGTRHGLVHVTMDFIRPLPKSH